MSFGGGEKRSPQQIAEIEAANRMDAVDFSTPHGSQGVTNSNYATYTDSYGDLREDYNTNWRDKGVSKAEYGACLLYTSPSPRDVEESRMPSSA